MFTVSVSCLVTDFSLQFSCDLLQHGESLRQFHWDKGQCLLPSKEWNTGEFFFPIFPVVNCPLDIASTGTEQLNSSNNDNEL